MAATDEQLEEITRKLEAQFSEKYDKTFIDQNSRIKFLQEKIEILEQAGATPVEGPSHTPLPKTKLFAEQEGDGITPSRTVEEYDLENPEHGGYQKRDEIRGYDHKNCIKPDKYGGKSEQFNGWHELFVALLACFDEK